MDQNGNEELNENRIAQAHEERLGFGQNFDYALRENENRQNYDTSANLVDYGTNWFPLCGVGAVCFPEQELPMKFNEDEQELYDRLVASARANGFVVVFPSDIDECIEPPYIATLTRVVQANPLTLSMKLMGVRRCKVISYNLEEAEALIQLLPEVEEPSLLSKHVPKYINRCSIDEKRSLATRITGYPFDVFRNITENHVEQCCNELKEMLGEETVNQARSRGLSYFSYFISQKIYSNRKTEYSLLKEDSANTRIAAALKYCKVSIGKCSRCSLPIFHNQNIMRLPEQTMTHVNAHGFVHKITLLSEIQNHARASAPSYQFTWFPDYAWIIIQCEGCHQHLGWEYISMTREPARFYGIQREGIRFQNDDQDNSGGVEHGIEEDPENDTDGMESNEEDVNSSVEVSDDNSDYSNNED